MPSTTRSISLGLVLGTALVVGAQFLGSGSAHGDEEAAIKPAQIKALRGQVAALQKQVEYLRSREDALTTYLLANDARGASFEAALEEARREGFLAKSSSAPSRIALMKGLAGMANSMRNDLPARSKSEERLRSQADAATRKAGSAAD